MTQTNPTAYQSIRTLANRQGNSLHQLQKHAMSLSKLQQQLQRYLPQSIAPHCRVVSWNKGKLTIGVDSASYMTELRYTSMQLRDQLRQHTLFANISAIVYKVIPLLNHGIDKNLLPEIEKATPKKIDPSIVKQLLSSAKVLSDSDNPETQYLQSVLERLAKNQINSPFKKGGSTSNTRSA